MKFGKVSNGSAGVIYLRIIFFISLASWGFLAGFSAWRLTTSNRRIPVVSRYAVKTHLTVPSGELLGQRSSAAYSFEADDFLDRLLCEHEWDVISCLFTAIILWYSYRIFKGFDIEDPFSGDIAAKLRIIAYLIILIWLFQIFKNMYIETRIKELTNNRFIFRPGKTYYSFAVALVVFIVSGVFKHGTELREERELTV